MRKKYKNQLFQYLSTLDIPIDHWEIETNEDKYRDVSIISLVNTPFKFIITTDKEDFNVVGCKYILYGSSYPLSEYSGPYGDFDSILSEFSYWLDKHINPYFEDEAEPDLWTAYLNNNKSLNPENIDFNDRAEFTTDEKQHVKLAMNELKHLIHSNFQTTQEEQRLVNARLDYLIDAVDRLNKFDWKGTALSMLMNISTALCLDTTRGEQLFGLFAKVISNLPQLIQ